MKEDNKTLSLSHSKARAPRWATLDDIRAVAGHGHLSDKEAQGILDAIRQLVPLMADFIQKQHANE